MNITVLTPDREIFKGAVNSVKVPGTKGQFQVLNNHAPIVSSLDPGEVTLMTAGGHYQILDETSGVLQEMDGAGKKVSFQISGGFIEVLNNEIALLVQGVKEIK